MTIKNMTSLERTLAVINHQEADKVPLFLLLSTYGAKELNMSPQEYFADYMNIVKAQLLIKEKYSNDCIYTFFYAAIEVEAFGGEVVFKLEGSPNAGAPIIKNNNDIKEFIIPEIEKIPPLRKVLNATRELKAIVGDEVPIIGVVMSPFSIPVMQMGFENYLELIYENREYFDLLMKKNKEFCVKWANAQLAAGATAICYFNPLASTDMIERETYLETGYPIDKEVLLKINGPTATHLASGRVQPVLEDIIKTGTEIVGFSNNDSLKKIKEVAKERICLLGNMNGLDMPNWSRSDAVKEVKNLINCGAHGGGLLISDNHGEIPWQVSEEVLLAIADTVNHYGRYPLERANQDG